MRRTKSAILGIFGTELADGVGESVGKYEQDIRHTDH
jgi:hypothetical protein